MKTCGKSTIRYGLTILLVFVCALSSEGLQSEPHPYSFSLEDARRDGTLVQKTDSSAINVATVAERKLLVRAFRLYPTFLFKTDDTNAYAFPPAPSNLDDDGTIVLGVLLLEREINSSQGTARNFAIPAIMGHEFGHLLQYKYGTTAAGVQTELQADYIAGWYLGNRNNGYTLTDRDLQAVLASFYVGGDYESADAQHHGTPEQRTVAVRAGFSRSTLKFNEVYEASMQFLGVSARPRLGKALRFSIEEFSSTLGKVMDARDTGFAALKGNPVPDSKTWWDAKIVLPSARECSVHWSNEYQGYYECTMYETFDLEIAKNEWQNLAEELEAEGWQTKDKTSSRTTIKSSTFKLKDDQDFTLDLENKSLSRSGYQVAITVDFDNY